MAISPKKLKSEKKDNPNWKCWQIHGDIISASAKLSMCDDSDSITQKKYVMLRATLRVQ